MKYVPQKTRNRGLTAVTTSSTQRGAPPAPSSRHLVTAACGCHGHPNQKITKPSVPGPWYGPRQGGARGNRRATQRAAAQAIPAPWRHQAHAHGCTTRHHSHHASPNEHPPLTWGAGNGRHGAYTAREAGARTTWPRGGGRGGHRKGQRPARARSYGGGDHRKGRRSQARPRGATESRGAGMLHTHGRERSGQLGKQTPRRHDCASRKFARAALERAGTTVQFTSAGSSTPAGTPVLRARAVRDDGPAGDTFRGRDAASARVLERVPTPAVCRSSDAAS